MSPVLSTVPSGGGSAGAAPSLVAEGSYIGAALGEIEGQPASLEERAARGRHRLRASSGSANVTAVQRPVAARSLTTKALRTGPASLKCSSKAASVASYGSERTKTVVVTSFILQPACGLRDAHSAHSVDGADGVWGR